MPGEIPNPITDPLAFLNALGSGPSDRMMAREDDATRIRDLPRHDPLAEAFGQVAVNWASERWQLHPFTPMQFRPIQAAALLTAHLTGGALLPLGTGWGKTLISLLAADALAAKRPLLLIPPAMRVPFDNARREYARSFRIPANLRVLAYSQLSNSLNTDALERMAPDVIVADEAHNLRHMDAARTKRVARYLTKHPGTRCVWMSGTLTSKSVKDYAHLSAWALKNGSPVPLPKHFTQLQAFAAVLDAKPVKTVGDSRYNAPAQVSDWVMFSPLFPDWEAWSDAVADEREEEETGVMCSPRVARARSLFRERLASTPGVVATSVASVGTVLRFMERKLDVSDVVAHHLERLDETWCRPDGEELVDGIAKYRCARQLSQGFFYRWVWPDGVVDVEWMRTRSAWHREVRRVLALNRPHLDSPLLVTQATRRAAAGSSSLVSEDDALIAAWLAWEPESQKRWGRGRTPPTETVWCDDYMVQDALRWLKDNPTGLLWYEDNAIGSELARHGVPVYGPGTNPEEIQGRFAAALSVHVHADGKNLQKHSTNLLLSWSPSGKVMEQLVSRTHRAGQEADEVIVEFYHHTEPAKAAVASSRNDARYIEDTTGVQQRLVYGDWIFASGA